MKKKISFLIILISCLTYCYSQNSTCRIKLKKGFYYSVSGSANRDTTFHKISDKYFIGFSMKTSFYYKNKLTWNESCKFRSEHFKNNSDEKRFRKGTGYKCELLEVYNDFFRFSYFGEETGSTGELKYYRYKGKIPKQFRKIKKMKHNPKGE